MNINSNNFIQPKINRNIKYVKKFINIKLIIKYLKIERIILKLITLFTIKFVEEA